MKLKR
jgi:hypothetical protein